MPRYGGEDACPYYVRVVWDNISRPVISLCGNAGRDFLLLKQQKSTAKQLKSYKKKGSN